MSKKKKSIEDEIIEFMRFFKADKIIDFLESIIPVFELWDVQDDKDWVIDEVGEENHKNVRIVRTAYLMSKLADKHCEDICKIKFNFYGFWRRLELYRDSIEKIENLESSNDDTQESCNSTQTQDNST